MEAVPTVHVNSGDILHCSIEQWSHSPRRREGEADTNYFS